MPVNRFDRPAQAPRVVALLLMALAIIAPTGCFGATGESRIENGQSVEIGQRRFDSYFSEVVDLRRKVADIDKELFPVREPLVEAISEAKPEDSLTKLMKHVRAKVQKLKNYGVTINLRLTPTPHVHIDGEREKDADEDSLIFAIKESALRALNEYNKFQQLLQVSYDLDDARAKLAEQIENLPAGVDRGAVEQEIVGAGRVLQEARKVLLGHSRTMSHFLVALATAADTGAADAHATKCEEALAQYKPPSKKPRGKGRPQGGGKGPGPAKPPPKPKPAGGDFDM